MTRRRSALPPPPRRLLTRLRGCSPSSPLSRACSVARERAQPLSRARACPRAAAAPPGRSTLSPLLPTRLLRRARVMRAQRGPRPGAVPSACQPEPPPPNFVPPTPTPRCLRACLPPPRPRAGVLRRWLRPLLSPSRERGPPPPSLHPCAPLPPPPEKTQHHPFDHPKDLVYLAPCPPACLQPLGLFYSASYTCSTAHKGLMHA